ncbi:MULTISPECIES: hypothetical protein [unclassified Burkholderia]|uniref:hypothetical protein n=1 Tax=unclassified Burkholderia TaxID=2613784 RepID=UPI000F59D717|nr:MULTISPECIES: hypothetical protein [unclassified Burkholderia]
MSKVEAIEANETKLANALQLVDCIAQEGLSEIISICSISLAAMTNPDFWSKTDDIATIMCSIRARADDLMNKINCEAEEHGCNWADHEQNRARHDAHESYVKDRAAFLQQVRGRHD